MTPIIVVVICESSIAYSKIAFGSLIYSPLNFSKNADLLCRDIDVFGEFTTYEGAFYFHDDLVVDA